MLRYVFLSFVLVPQLAVGQAVRPITEAENVFAIFTEDWGLGSEGGAKLLVSIWEDGSIVWSNDQVHGGAPYFSATIDPNSVKKAFQRIAEKGVFDVKSLEQAHWGPDSQFTAILFRHGGRKLRMESWHELYESNGKVVAADHGLTSLNGKKLLPALASEPSDYLHYRMTWLELRLAAMQLIPRDEKATDGVTDMRAGELSWQPSGDKN